jgi:hypothetical protein
MSSFPQSFERESRLFVRRIPAYRPLRRIEASRQSRFHGYDVMPHPDSSILRSTTKDESGLRSSPLPTLYHLLCK